ncbi:hypothetical protein KJZ63_02050 [Patescibacteria group bacterium]|nr:hypothetical protein [Patescibacteria group bacterium]
MTDTNFFKGEIIVGTHRTRATARHPIIFWDKRDDHTFLGLVLTHSSRENNHMMKSEHFKVSLLKNFNFDPQNPTYLVAEVFIKPDHWGPYKKVGDLTKEGIAFVENLVSNNKPLYWFEFREFSKNRC